MDWFLAALKKYAVFSGRAQRSEYWFFALFYLIIAIVLSVLESIVGATTKDTSVGLFTSLFFLGMLLPSLAVTVRRLHDTGRSGFWILIGLLPFIGSIVLLVFTVLDSQPGDNAYGPNPKLAT
jgi:uncharacterized membrane protein YhaH (DUF805 family)